MRPGDHKPHGPLLHLQFGNLLSFGPETPALSLENLNVLIGPNGAGKSNVIEALSLLRATPVSASASNTDLRGVVRRGGGVAEWVWKGGKASSAGIDVGLNYPLGKQRLRHILAFRGDEQGFRIEDERIEDCDPYQEGAPDPYFYYRFQGGNPVVNTTQDGRRKLARETVGVDQSVLSQLRDPERYPELAWLAGTYEKIRIYRDWSFGRNTVFREPQKTDMRNDRLEEDFSNLGLVLSRLRKSPKVNPGSSRHR